MTRKHLFWFPLFFVAVGCASKSHQKQAVEKEMGTKQAVALQTTQTGAEGSDIKIDALIATASISPYPKKGELQGFRLDDVKPKSPWTKAGFKKGDIIIRIGDQAIESRDDLMVVFYALGAKASLEVEVLREGPHHKQKNVIFELGP